MLLLVGRKAFGAVAVVFCITVVLCIYGVGAWFSDLGLGGQIRLILAASAVFDLLLVVVFTYGWRLLWRCIPALNNLLFPDWNGTWDVEINWQWKREDRDRVRQGKGETEPAQTEHQSAVRAHILGDTGGRAQEAHGLRSPPNSTTFTTPDRPEATRTTTRRTPAPRLSCPIWTTTMFCAETTSLIDQAKDTT